MRTGVGSRGLEVVGGRIVDRRTVHCTEPFFELSMIQDILLGSVPRHFLTNHQGYKGGTRDRISFRAGSVVVHVAFGQDGDGQ